MATRLGHQIVKEYSAAGDLSSKQYLFMEDAGTAVDATNAVTDRACGVLQNKPDAAGKHAEVAMFGGTKVVAGAAINRDDPIGCDAAGKAVAVVIGTDTTVYILGRALTGASGDGIVISAVINCINPARAA